MELSAAFLKLLVSIIATGVLHRLTQIVPRDGPCAVAKASFWRTWNSKSILLSSIADMNAAYQSKTLPSS
jgi:hypothetical protein